MSPLGQWVLSIMTAMQPSAAWDSTYPKTAEAIATVANDSPLFSGARKEAKTASLLLAISYLESRFRNEARGGNGRWLCLMQISREHLSKQGQAEVLRDPEACLRAAVPIVQRSFQTCRRRPESEWLGAYAASSCQRGAKASRGRMNLAAHLLRRHQASLPPAAPARTL